MAKKSSGSAIPDRVPLGDVMATGPEGAVTLEQAVRLSQAGASPDEWASDPQVEATEAMQLDPSPDPVQTSFPEEPEDEAETGDVASAYKSLEPAQAPASTDQPSATPDYDPDLLEVAGLTVAEAQAQFKSPEALANAVRLLNMRYIQAGEGYAAPSQSDDVDPRHAGTQAPVSDEYQLPKPTESEDWTDDVKALITSLHTHQAQQLGRRDAELQRQREQLESLLLQQSERDRIAYAERLDAFVNNLGDEWTPILGKGSGFQLPENSLVLQNRIQLDAIAGKLAHGRSKHGQPDLKPNALYVMALHAAFPDQVVRSVRQDVTRQLESRQRQFTAKPTQKQGRQLSGVDQAIAHAEDWYRTKGPILDDGDEDI